MSKEFMFHKSLSEDKPTDYGQKHLNELYSYIREHLDGLKTLCFWSYRMENVQCFAVDMSGINGKNCALNIGVTHTSHWQSMLHTVDIDVVDGIDALGIVQYLVGTFNLCSVREERDNGTLIYSVS